MKTWTISIIVILTLCQCKTKNTEKNEQSLVIAEVQTDTCTKKNTKEMEETVSLEQLNRCSFIGESLDSEIEIEKKYNIILNFSILEIYEYDINNDGIKEKIILDELNEWNDPGDFHRIRIEYRDTCFTFYNSTGWVKIQNSSNDYIHDFASINKIKSDYIVLIQNNDNLLLMAFGYVYASNPGLLSIINLSANEPQLILNDNCLLVKYEEHNPMFITTRYFPEDEINQFDTLILMQNGFFKK
ncbi:MAG: hypothetical protein LBQ28_07870 [Prevotellaceae bacterium]|jgi:hypothetical protein|nr:hypothetical protein [Prevotellaceae bacterium]